MKKLVRFGSVFLGLTLVLAMNAYGETTQGGKTKVTLWSQFADPNSQDSGSIAFYKALEATKAKFPDVTFEHVGSGGEAYKQKLPVASAADELPDMFFAWGGGASEPFIAGKRVLALDDLAKDGTLNRLVPGTTNNFMFGGKLYGLPIYITTANLYVNKELFDKAGAKLPTTYDELLTAVGALKKKGIVPVALGAKDRWPAMFWAAILDIRMGGVPAMNAALKKTGSFDTPEFVSAAGKLQELVKAGAFGPNYLGTSYDDSVNLFLTGKAAMLYMGGWVNSQIDGADSPVKGKVVPLKFPTVAGGRGNIDEWHGGSGETFLLNAKVQNKALMWSIYKYFMESMASAAYLAGSGASAWQGGTADDSKVDPLAVQIGKLSAQATGFSYWWDQMLNGNDTESMFGALMKLVILQTTPQQYAKDMQAKIYRVK